MPRRSRFTWTLSAVLALSLFACGGDSEPIDPNATPDEQAAVKAFRELCVTCHGKGGKGDGAGAAALDPKPRSFCDKDWQASVTDEHIKKVITYGGSVAGKSAAMPAQPQLKSKPKVLDALVKYVRKFGQQNQN